MKPKKVHKKSHQIVVQNEIRTKLANIFIEKLHSDYPRVYKKLSFKDLSSLYSNYIDVLRDNVQKINGSKK